MEKLHDYIAVDADEIHIESDPTKPCVDVRKERAQEDIDSLARKILLTGQQQNICVERRDGKLVVTTGVTRVLAVRRLEQWKQDVARLYHETPDVNVVAERLGLSPYLVGKLQLCGTVRTKIHAREDEPRSAADIKIMQLVENMARRQLSPIEEALQYQELKQMLGTPASVGERVDVSESVVVKRLQLLKLPAFLQEAVHKGMAQNRAFSLAKMDLEEARQIVEGNATLPKSERKRGPTKKKVREYTENAAQVVEYFQQADEDSQQMHTELLNGDQSGMSDRLRGQLEALEWMLGDAEEVPAALQKAAAFSASWKAHLESQGKSIETDDEDDFEDPTAAPAEEPVEAEPTPAEVEESTDTQESVTETPAEEPVAETPKVKTKPKRTRRKKSRKAPDSKEVSKLQEYIRDALLPTMGDSFLETDIRSRVGEADEHQVLVLPALEGMVKSGELIATKNEDYSTTYTIPQDPDESDSVVANFMSHDNPW